LQLDVAPDPRAVQMVWPAGQLEAQTPCDVQTSPVGQSGVQTPLEQVCPAVHAVPQPPQLFGSFCVSAHWLPHAT
jgi:hypothetical protein